MTTTTLIAPQGADLRYDLIFLQADGSEYDLSGATVSVVLAPPRGGEPVTLTLGSGLVASGYDNRVSISVDKAAKAAWAKGLWRAEVRATEGAADDILVGFFLDVCTYGVPMSGEMTVVVGSAEVTLAARGPAGVPFPGDGATVTANAPLFDLSQTWNNGAEAFTALRADVTDTASAAASKLFDLLVGGASKFSVRKDGFLNLAAGIAAAGAITVGGETVWHAGTLDPTDFAQAAHSHVIGDVTGLQAALDAKLNAAAFTWGNLGDKPTTAAGFGLTDVVTLAGAQTVAGAKTFSDNLRTNGSLTVDGDLLVSGNTVTLNTATLDVEDVIITAGAGNALAAAPYIGLKAERGATDAFFVWDESDDYWAAFTSADDLATAPTLAGLKAARVLVGDGSVGAPAFAFASAPSNGFYFGSGEISVSMAGSKRFSFAGTQFVLLSSLSTISFAGDAILARDAANVLAMRNGTAAQRFHLHNTYTDPSNYERLEIGANAGNMGADTFGIMSNRAGTGVNRNLHLGTNGSASLALVTNGTNRWLVNSGGHFLANADSTYDIGQVGNSRPRNVYVGAGVFAVSLTTTSHINGGGYILAGTSNVIGWSGRSFLDAPSDGVIRLTNNAVNDFGRLQFGGTTSSFPALKRSAAELEVRLADDSAYGTLRAQFGIWMAGMRVSADGGFLSLGAANDVVLIREGANILAQRNGANAQRFFLYNTFIDSSNYERLDVGWSGNTAIIRTLKAGTGSARGLSIGSADLADCAFITNNLQRWLVHSAGNFLPAFTNTHDLGSASLTVRTGYFGTSLQAPLLTPLGGDNTGSVGSAAVRWSNVYAQLLSIRDGIAAPAAIPNYAQLFVDAADGDLKVIFADGTVKTIVTDT